MRLLKFRIQKFRSIDEIVLSFPDNKPLVLFGPNNVGKSSILKSMDIMLGERWAPNLDYEDSDFFFRDKQANPNISLAAKFDNNYKWKGKGASDTVYFSTNHQYEAFGGGFVTEHTYHYPNGNKMYLSNEERASCQFLLVDASRDITRQFSYFSKYSLLSQMAKRMHHAMVAQKKEELQGHFETIKGVFEEVPEYNAFYNSLKTSFAGSIEGFEHKLELDLSAFDPNNYFKSLKIIAKEGDQTRSFDEFGTGEQQILLMAFVKAYAETFKGEHFILGIEEPESHLHPLAQKWFAKNIFSICESGIQVVITTHSPEFLEITNLEGFVRVHKVNDVTCAIQHSAESFAEHCIKTGANAEKTTAENILPFYRSNTFYDQLKGFFARKIILVEGPTEAAVLQNYFENCGFDLVREGVEVIDCRGKSQIARNCRLFTAYGYSCYCLFDADSTSTEAKRANKELADLLAFDLSRLCTDPDSFTQGEGLLYGYFGKDFESYMYQNFDDYKEKEDGLVGSKPLKAKILSESDSKLMPDFIVTIATALGLTRYAQPEEDMIVNG